MNQESKTGIANRNKILRYLLLAFVGVIAVRLFWIQIIQHDEWQAKADEQQTQTNAIVAKRGEIYMMDEDTPAPVAMNETVWTVIVDPMTADEEAVKKAIDENAGAQKVAEWGDVFSDKSRRYYVVAKNVERAAAEKIVAADLAGVWMQENTKRVYPEGELASGLLGFVNADGEGQYGVEGAFDEELAGTDGLLKTVTDVNNVSLSIGEDNVKVPAQDGEDIVLTVDRNIQHRVEQILSEAVASSAYGATNASAVVLDPKTGRVLAMANVPNYDPANYGDVEDARAYINYTLEEPYEPASVCKTFAFAAAINEGVMTPETTYVNTGSVEIDGATIVNAYKGQLGTISMQTVLNYSLNTGSIQALRLLGGSTTEITEAGRTKLYDYYYNRFGLGQNTGIELAESSGLIMGPNDGYAMNLTYANMTFGQGLNLTMMQVGAALASVVNGGKYYAPTVVAGTMVDGEFVEKEQAEAVRTVMTEEASATMRTMLYGGRSLMRSMGIDKAGYYIGGKTGTAQVVRDGAYSEASGNGETIGSYVGFGGTEGEMPEYVVVTKIWADGKHFEGERDARPIFNDISNYLIDYMKIPPKT